MSGKTRTILIILGVVVIALLAWFFLLNPVRDDIDAVEMQIEEEQTMLSQAQVKLAQAESLREEGRKNQARLLELAKMMPTSDEIPSLLLQIQDLANQSGIDFIAISPGESQDSATADYRILPLDLEFSGTFFDVSDFIYRAEQMVAGPGRLLAIKNLDLSLNSSPNEEATSTTPELTASVTMYAFLAGGQSAAPTPTQATPNTGSDASTSGSDVGVTNEQ